MMEGYEDIMLEWAAQNPSAADTSVNWPHSPDRLRDFLIHLNSNHQTVHFTIQVEREATFHSWTQMFTGNLLALWAITHTKILSITNPLQLYVLSPTTQQV
jgi:hypothetical protein